MAKKSASAYLQAAVIPWRERDGQVEVLLITTSNRRRWIIPKGVIDPGMSPLEAAEIEAWEEAGIRGTFDEEPVGCFTYRKWGGTCKVSVFTMAVDAVVDDFPEASFRKRLWLSPEAAAQKVGFKGVPELIQVLAERLAPDKE